MGSLRHTPCKRESRRGYSTCTCHKSSFHQEGEEGAQPLLWVEPQPQQAHSSFPGQIQTRGQHPQLVWGVEALPHQRGLAPTQRQVQQGLAHPAPHHPTMDWHGLREEPSPPREEAPREPRAEHPPGPHPGDSMGKRTQGSHPLGDERNNHRRNCWRAGHTERKTTERTRARTTSCRASPPSWHLKPLQGFEAQKNSCQAWETGMVHHHEACLPV